MRPPQPHPQRISPKASKDDAQAPKVVLRTLSGPKRSCSCSCRSSRSFAALRGQKEVAVAVLRGPPCPLWTKGVAVAVLRGPSRPFVEKRSCRCRCRSPWPSVALRVLCGQKVLPLPFFAVLRGPSWKKEVAVAVAVAVLRGPPCPPCPLWTKGVAVAVLRGPSWKKEVAVTVLRHPPRTKQNKRQHTQRLQKGLSRISRTGRISYNYNQ